MEQAADTHSDSNVIIGELEAKSTSEGRASDPFTPGDQTPLSEGEPDIVDAKIEEIPMPPLPSIPKINPYADELSMKVNR